MGDFYWHIHHEILCEVLAEPIENRIRYIRENKPKHEIETRLRLMRPVKHPKRLPSEWKEADQKRKEAYQKWKEAYQKWEEADQKRRHEIETLHKEECHNCPWDGKTIFP